ncbi:MAG: toll/interleukin-1 receptor domain-containing protein [Verrucomicrobiaceae bacterium]|nr:toll/interleukin-1 receptor domain-containing protein [Verrucomicrobiaceae bacterium]
MNTYLSWSGEDSRKAASALRRVISEVAPNTIVFSGWEDIKAGEHWQRAMIEQLQQADMALFFITPSNLHSPWIHFEAGAIVGRGLPIVPILVGVQPSQLSGPLNAYQSVSTSQESLSRLLIHLGGTPSRVAEAVPALSRDLALIAHTPTGSTSTEASSAAFDKAWEQELQKIKPTS